MVDSTWCPEGEWKTSVDEACIPCIVDKWCLGLNNSCAIGHGGFGCEECASGYFRFGEECNACPSAQVSQLYWGLGAVGCVSAIFVIYSLSEFSMDVTTIGIGTAHFQMMFVYFTIGADNIPRKVLDYMDMVGVACGYVDVLQSISGPECIGMREFPFILWWLIASLLPILVCLPFIAIIMTTHHRQAQLDKAKLNFSLTEGRDSSVESPAHYDGRRSIKHSRKKAVKTLLIIVTLAFMYGVSMGVQMWSCVEDEAGVSRLVADRSIVCEWSNTSFLQLQILSVVVFGVYFFGTGRLYVSVVDSKRGRQLAVEHNVTHARMMKRATAFDALAFFGWSLVKGGDRHYRRLLRAREAHDGRTVGLRASRLTLEDLESQVLGTPSQRAKTIDHKEAAAASAGPGGESTAAAPPERRRSSARYGHGNDLQRHFLSCDASFPVLVPPPEDAAASHIDPAQAAAATQIQKIHRGREARAQYRREYRSREAQLLRALEGDRGTIVVVLVVALDLALMIALEKSDGGDASHDNLVFSSELVGYFCSMFFIVDIVVRYACYTRTQPPERRASCRASLANLDFFSKDRMRLLDLVIVVLDGGGTVLLLVLAASSSSSSDSLSGLMFAKAGRALRLARLARWLRVLSACLDSEKQWHNHTQDAWVRGICHGDLSEVATGSREDGTLHVGAYENARMMFERNRHIVITDDLVQWVKQDSDLPQAMMAAPLGAVGTVADRKLHKTRREHMLEKCFGITGEYVEVQFPRTTRWTFFIDLSQSLGIDFQKHHAQRHHHHRYSPPRPRALTNTFSPFTFSFSSASSSADDADSESSANDNGSEGAAEGASNLRGVVVRKVNHHSQCFHAGLQHRCEIFKIGTTRVSTPEELELALIKRRIVSAEFRKRKIEEEKELEKARQATATAAAAEEHSFRPETNHSKKLKKRKSENDASMKSATASSTPVQSPLLPLSAEDEALLADKSALHLTPEEVVELEYELFDDSMPGAGMLCTCEFMDPNFMVRRRIPYDFVDLLNIVPHVVEFEDWWESYGHIVSRYKAGFRHWEQWVNIRKLSVVVAQYILATKYNATVATVFILFVQVISLMLIYRLEPYDDMNSDNIFNQADSMLPNNTLEKKLLTIQILQLSLMLGSTLLVRPSEILLTVLYVALVLLGACCLLVAMSSTAGRVVIHLWHTLEPYLREMEHFFVKKLWRVLSVLSCGRVSKTDQRARDAAAAAAAAMQSASASASSATRRLIGEQRRRENEVQLLRVGREHEGAQQRRSMQKLISQMSQLFPGGGMRRDNSSVVSFFSMATRRRESNQERRTMQKHALNLAVDAIHERRALVRGEDLDVARREWEASRAAGGKSTHAIRDRHFMLGTAASKQRNDDAAAAAFQHNHYKDRKEMAAILDDAKKTWASRGGKSTKHIAEKHYMKTTVVSSHHTDRKQLSSMEKDKKWMLEGREHMNEDLVKQHEIWLKRQKKRAKSADGSWSLHTNTDTLGHFASATFASKNQHDLDAEIKATTQRVNLEKEHLKWLQRQKQNHLHTETETLGHFAQGTVTSKTRADAEIEQDTRTLEVEHKKWDMRRKTQMLKTDFGTLGHFADATEASKSSAASSAKKRSAIAHHRSSVVSNPESRTKTEFEKLGHFAEATEASKSSAASSAKKRSTIALQRSASSFGPESSTTLPTRTPKKGDKGAKASTTPMTTPKQRQLHQGKFSPA